jgi:hypothetical protein
VIPSPNKPKNPGPTFNDYKKPTNNPVRRLTYVGGIIGETSRSPDHSTLINIKIDASILSGYLNAYTKKMDSLLIAGMRKV